MTRERQVRAWLIGIAVFLVALYVLRGVLLPFAAGMAVAYFLDPVADRLESLGLSRLWATIVITLGFILVMVLVLVLLVPALQHQIGAFLENAPRYAQALVNRGQDLLIHLKSTLGEERMQELTTALQSYAGDAARWLVRLINQVITGSFALINLISLIVLMPVVAFYMLRDWDRMVAAIDEKLPKPYAPQIRARFREIDETIAGFLRGQASVCLALGTFYAIGLTLAGLDLGLIVGMMSGLLSFIPYVGTITGGLASIGLALAQFNDWVDIAIVAGIFGAGQIFEGNVLTPRLVGDRVGLHPVWVIFALLAGATLFGFLGILLAVPVAAVIGVLVRAGLREYQDSALFHGVLPVAAGPARPARDGEDDEGGVSAEGRPEGRPAGHMS